MGFPVPGDAFEPHLDLNQHLIQNPAATFFMRVDGETAASEDVQSGDLLVIDRSHRAREGSLVVAAIAGELVVVRVQQQRGQLVPPGWDRTSDLDFEIWGVVTTLIRQV